jgi:hypothetical protein
MSRAHEKTRRRAGLGSSSGGPEGHGSPLNSVSDGGPNGSSGGRVGGQFRSGLAASLAKSARIAASTRVIASGRRTHFSQRPYPTARNLSEGTSSLAWTDGDDGNYRPIAATRGSPQRAHSATLPVVRGANARTASMKRSAVRAVPDRSP